MAAVERFAASSSSSEDIGRGVDLSTFDIWGSARFGYDRLQSGSPRSSSTSRPREPAGPTDHFFMTDLLFSRNAASQSLHAPGEGHSSDDDEALQWAALERLPTFNRLRTSILAKKLGSRVVHEELDVTKLGLEQQQQIIDKLLRGNAEEDNERFLHKLRDRIDRYCTVQETMAVSINTRS